MIDGARGCLAGVGCFTLLVAGVGAGWAYHDDIATWWEAKAPARAAAEPSEELARRALDRLTKVLGADAGGEVRVSAAELRSLVRYRLAPRLPPGVSRPDVALREPSLEVSAGLDFARLLDGGVPGLVKGMVGDSARVTARLRPEVPAPGRLRLRVEEIRADGVRVPSAVLPWLLREVGAPVADDDPRTLQIEVGLGLTGARVGRDSLVLVRTAGGG